MILDPGVTLIPWYFGAGVEPSLSEMGSALPFLAGPQISHVALGKSLHSPVSQFSPLYNGENRPSVSSPGGDCLSLGGGQRRMGARSRSSGGWGGVSARLA